MARLALTFLFITTTIVLISAQCNKRTAVPSFKRSIYEFNLKLMKRINQETESHFVVSGLSPWALLAAVSLGASDTTLAELQQVLRLNKQNCFNNIYFDLIKDITKPDGNMERSATIFFDEGLSIKPTFLAAASNAGICDAKIVSFADTEVTARFINEYVSSATNEAIVEIVTPSDLKDLSLVMIDALYFKGIWKTSFPFGDTETSAFYNEKIQQIGDVLLMYVNGKFNVTRVAQIKAQVLELPYDESRFSMLIFLPDEGTTITTMIESMKQITISSVFILFERFGPITVDVQIPKFKISSDIDNLKELLYDMGLRSAFDSTAASFPGISDYELNLSNVIQKADIEVTEEGTTASAATAAMFESRMLPEQFVANKPFVFMIVDREFQVPVFSGAYSKPSNNI